MAWSEILEHDFTKRVLQKHLASGRIPNAYLLAGAEGIGKRRLALEMAKAINCLSQGERPCDGCATCGQIARGVHPDVHRVEPSGASEQIKIDDVRHVIARVQLRPFNARLQVAIIDGADRLTEEAANSLLKVLEEPTTHTRFMLTTARLAFCLPTIVSRCHVLRCAPLTPDAVQRLLEPEGVPPSRLRAASRFSGGSISQARALIARWDERQRTLKRLATSSLSSWMEEPLPDTRQDVAELLETMTAWIRDLAVTGLAGSSAVAHAEHVEALRRQAHTVDPQRCVHTAMELVELRESLEQYANPRLLAALAREKWLSLTTGTFLFSPSETSGRK